MSDSGNNSGSRKTRARSLLDAGRVREARDIYRHICEVDRVDVEAWFMQGLAGGALGDYRAAEHCLRKVISLQPALPEAHYNLGNALKQQGRLEPAIECFKAAVRLMPSPTPAIYVNLGNTLTQCDRPAEAIKCFTQAIAIQPDDANSQYNLGIALRMVGELDRAVSAFHAAIRLRSDFTEAYNNLGIVFLDQRCYDEALESYRTALQIDPGNSQAYSNLLQAMNYQVLDPADVFEAHAGWDRRYAGLQPVFTDYPNKPDPERKLRIGYLSPDLHTHSVSYFFEPLLERHDRSNVEIICYADTAHPDATTDRLKRSADRWHDISASSDDQVAALIRADCIDILVDLVGHAGHHRLAVFARKPAPVQVNYLGYPNTTGLSAMGYRFTDAWADPPQTADAYHSEMLVRLPDGFLCYRPPADAPAVEPLAAAAAGYVTFGSFNHFSKINNDVFEAWAAILLALPDARLLVKHKTLADAALRRRVHEFFLKHGIEQERVELMAYIPATSGHLNLYNRIDIALDTFPYNGTATTCEALWMGVPVIVLAGATHVARVGVSLLSQTGLTDCIADSKQAYIDKAVVMAGDLPRLAAIRAGMRQMLCNSALCDESGFAREVEHAYREMWRAWCVQSVGGGNTGS